MQTDFWFLDADQRADIRIEKDRQKTLELKGPVGKAQRHQGLQQSRLLDVGFGDGAIEANFYVFESVAETMQILANSTVETIEIHFQQ